MSAFHASLRDVYTNKHAGWQRSHHYQIHISQGSLGVANFD